MINMIGETSIIQSIYRCLGAFGVLITLTGCATFQVTRNTTKIAGIPFYVKTAACKHQTAYLEPYYVLTLTRTSFQELPYAVIS